MTRKTGLVLLPYSLLLLFLFTTDPERLPAWWLLVPFALIFWGLWVSFYYGLRALGPKKTGSSGKRLALAFCLAMLPTLLLALQSINQLTTRDVLILVIFITFLALYITRANFLKR